jgi:hypothetical protein
MSPRTVFLSKLIGLYCLLVALSMLTHREATGAAVNLLLHDPAVLLIGALAAVVVGLATILGHNVWSGGAPAVIVTLFGWIALIKGVIILFLPTQVAAGYLTALRYEQLFYSYAALMVVLGTYLTYAGFKSASIPTRSSR